MEWGNGPAGRSRVAVVVVLLAAACGGRPDAGSSLAAVVVDTLPGGMRHVVNSPTPEGLTPRWRLEETGRIGDLEGPGAFGLIKGIAVMEDGTLAVLDALAKEVRIFDPSGAPVAGHGRDGDGPGEFREPYGLMLGSDGLLYVPDFRAARVSVVDPATGFVESFPWRVLSRGYVWRGAMTDDGRILKPSITLEEPRRDIVRVFDRTMTQVDSLPLESPPEVDPEDLPGMFYWEAPGGMPQGYMYVPYFPQPQFAFDRQGAVWSTADGDSGYRIKRWMPGGDTLLVVESQRPPVPVTEAERDSAIAPIRESLVERGADMPDWGKIPRTRPAVVAIFPAANGELWVEVSHAGTGAVYDRFDAGGAFLGSVASELRIWPYVRPVIRDDRVWAVVTDELDVQYVVVADIRPASAPAN